MARRVFQGRQSQRRRTGWEQGPGAPSAIQTAISSSVTQIFNFGQAPTVDGQTVVRIRGELLIYLSQATAAVNGFLGAFGIGLVSSAAFTAGAASVPGPVGEIEWEGWMYWTPIQLLSAAAIDAGVSADVDAINGVSAVHRIPVDTKAMRKKGTQETLMACIEVTEVGTATMQMAFSSRMLNKLP